MHTHCSIITPIFVGMLNRNKHNSLEDDQQKPNSLTRHIKNMHKIYTTKVLSAKHDG